MKRVNCFMMLAAAFALTLGVTSCNKNEAIETGEIKPGEPTSLELSIYMPRVPKTYSAGVDDLNATAGEIGMDKVNVLIYAEIAGDFILEQNETRTSGQFTKDLVNSDKYKLNNDSKIATTTGKKKLHVIMNAPDAAILPAVGSRLTYLSDFIYTLGSADVLSSDDNKFTMSSVQEKEVELVAETTAGTTPDANKAEVTVKRLVAKVTVQEASTLRTGSDIVSSGSDGIFTNLQFAIGNANQKIYVFQKKVGTAPDIVVQDPNWTLNPYASTDFFPISDYTSASTDYQAVDLSTVTEVRDLKTAYAPENTAEEYFRDGKNLTYISVRAQFNPDFFCDDQGDPTANSGPVVPFWTVTKSDGSILYFDDVDNARDFQASSAGSTISEEYEDGYCYFRAYINKNGAADTNIPDSKAAKFDVLRNNYYQATIKSIKAPGNHEDKGNPEEETSLLMDIIVQAWAVVTDDYDLH